MDRVSILCFYKMSGAKTVARLGGSSLEHESLPNKCRPNFGCFVFPTSLWWNLSSVFHESRSAHGNLNNPTFPNSCQIFLSLKNKIMKPCPLQMYCTANQSMCCLQDFECPCFFSQIYFKKKVVFELNCLFCSCVFVWRLDSQMTSIMRKRRGFVSLGNAPKTCTRKENIRSVLSGRCNVTTGSSEREISLQLTNGC